MQLLHLRGLVILQAPASYSSHPGEVSIAEIEKSEIDFIDAVVPRNRARSLVQDLQRVSQTHPHASRPLVFCRILLPYCATNINVFTHPSRDQPSYSARSTTKTMRQRHAIYKLRTHYFRPLRFAAVTTTFNGRRTGMGCALGNHGHGSL